MIGALASGRGMVVIAASEDADRSGCGSAATASALGPHEGSRGVWGASWDPPTSGFIMIGAPASGWGMVVISAGEDAGQVVTELSATSPAV
jgi:hypothetical protein